MNKKKLCRRILKKLKKLSFCILLSIVYLITSLFVSFTTPAHVNATIAIIEPAIEVCAALLTQCGIISDSPENWQGFAQGSGQMYTTAQQLRSWIDEKGASSVLNGLVNTYTGGRATINIIPIDMTNTEFNSSLENYTGLTSNFYNHFFDTDTQTDYYGVTLDFTDLYRVADLKGFSDTYLGTTVITDVVDTSYTYQSWIGYPNSPKYNHDYPFQCIFNSNGTKILYISTGRLFVDADNLKSELNCIIAYHYESGINKWVANFNEQPQPAFSIYTQTAIQSNYSVFYSSSFDSVYFAKTTSNGNLNIGTINSVPKYVSVPVAEIPKDENIKPVLGTENLIDKAITNPNITKITNVTNEYYNVADPSTLPEKITPFSNSWSGAFSDCVPYGVYKFEKTAGTYTGVMGNTTTGTWEGVWSNTTANVRTWTGTYTDAQARTWEGVITESVAASTDGALEFDVPFARFDLPDLLFLILRVIVSCILLVSRFLAYCATLPFISAKVPIYSDTSFFGTVNTGIALDGFNFLKGQQIPYFEVSVWDLISGIGSIFFGMAVIRRVRRIYNV